MHSEDSSFLVADRQNVNDEIKLVTESISS